LKHHHSISTQRRRGTGHHSGLQNQLSKWHAAYANASKERPSFRLTAQKLPDRGQMVNEQLLCLFVNRRHAGPENPRSPDVDLDWFDRSDTELNHVGQQITETLGNLTQAGAAESSREVVDDDLSP
jgi:hypothetical protein